MAPVGRKSAIGPAGKTDSLTIGKTGLPAGSARFVLGTVDFNGGAGKDRIWASGKADLVLGGSGPDRLWGGKGPDRLSGGTGRDRAVGEGGRDRCTAEVRRSCERD